jgi:hypothetical protein
MQLRRVFDANDRQLTDDGSVRQRLTVAAFKPGALPWGRTQPNKDFNAAKGSLDHANENVAVDLRRELRNFAFPNTANVGPVGRLTKPSA